MSKKKRDTLTSSNLSTRSIDIATDLGSPFIQTSSGEVDVNSTGCHTGPRGDPEYALGSSNWAEATIGPLSQPWVEDRVSPDTSAGYQLGSVTRRVAAAKALLHREGIYQSTSRGSQEDIDQGTSRGSQEGIDQGISRGSQADINLGSSEGTERVGDLGASQCTEEAEGDHSIQEAFWRLLHDAGYDVW